MKTEFTDMIVQEHLNILPTRQLFRESSGKGVREILGKHVGNNERLIEIGSGLGWLMQLVPEYKNRTIQVEIDQGAAELHATSNPESRIVVSDTLNLPFADDSFGAVIDLNTTDRFVNLEKILSSLWRTLSKNGKMIHLRDVNVVPMYSSDLHGISYKGYVPFPVFDETFTHYIGIRLVPHRVVQNLDIFIPAQRDFISIYAEQYRTLYPRFALSHFGQSSLPSHTDEFTLLAWVGQKLAPNARIIDFRDYYSSRLEKALARKGYQILDSGNMESHAIVQRKPEHSKYGDTNLLTCDIGRLSRSYSDEITQRHGVDKIKLVTILSYIVAQKT